MGLSTKQVSSDGLDSWSQSLLQEPIFELPKAHVESEKRQTNPQVEQLKCPRCESTNTKFCYYNNYNKTQPRHFCRACKRHWTKGGTLRNVPVGGHGRKNKRTRKPNPSSTSIAKTTTNPTRVLMSNTNLAFDRSNGGHQSSITTSSELGNHLFSSSLNTTTSTTMPFSFLQGGRSQVVSFPFSRSSTTSSSFDTISTSFQSPSLCNYLQEQFTSMEEPTITSIIPPANNPSGSGGVAYVSNDWNWEDIETLVSTDLNVAWDDSIMNPL